MHQIAERTSPVQRHRPDCRREIRRDSIIRGVSASRPSAATGRHSPSWRARGADTLFGVARRILRDVGLAEDAVQQTLVIAWREVPRLRDPDRFDAWLQRMLVRACYAEARRKRARACRTVIPGQIGVERRATAKKLAPADGSLAVTDWAWSDIERDPSPPPRAIEGVARFGGLRV